MLQNPCKTLGFKKSMVYKIPPGGGGEGKPYPARGLYVKRKVTLITLEALFKTFQTIQLYKKTKKKSSMHAPLGTCTPVARIRFSSTGRCQFRNS